MPFQTDLGICNCYWQVPTPVQDGGMHDRSQNLQSGTRIKSFIHNDLRVGTLRCTLPGVSRSFPNVVVFCPACWSAVESGWLRLSREV
jgi:hypothetical protein